MRSSGVPDRPGSRIWRRTIFVVPVPASVMIAAANLNRFAFCSGTLPYRRRSDTSGANRSCRTPLTIVLEFQWRGKQLKTYSRLVEHVIGDSVLYHSLSWVGKPAIQLRTFI